MTYRFNKVDLNQRLIVEVLREHGVSVQPLNAQKEGVTDLLCGYNSLNHLLEVKGPAGKLTPAQIKWHSEWNGPLAIVHSPEEAFIAVGLSSCQVEGCQYHTGACHGH